MNTSESVNHKANGSLCPPVEVLAGLGLDSMQADEQRILYSHIYDCLRCQAVLDQLLVAESSHTINASPIPAPGTRQIPKLPGFEIESELGRGGMGVVYRARTTDTDRLVAVKIVANGLLDSPDVKRWIWLREARLLARVPRHPNVVQFHHAGRHGDCLYLVLELVSSGTLREHLAEPLPPRDAARILQAVTEGVAHIHASGLYHLDIKPSNILLDGSWESSVPMLSDFGIARLIENPSEICTTTLIHVGTPKYMAPEQFMDDRRKIGPETDVYALGATLYHLLTGHPPFQSAKSEGLRRLVCEQDPVPPTRFNPAIPRDLEVICLKCLKKSPEQRYRTARALADDLKNWRTGRPITARPASSVERSWRWCRRRPATTGLLASILLLVIGSSLGLWTLWRRAEFERQIAEKDYVETSKTLNRLVSFTLKTFDPGRPSGDYTSILEVARNHELAHRERKSDDGGWRLATIDRLLGSAYHFISRLDEAGLLFSESLDLWDVFLERYPNNMEARWDQMQASIALGQIVNILSLKDPALYSIERWSERADLIATHLMTSEYNMNVITMLSGRRCDMAYMHTLSGAFDRARWLLLADLRMLESLPPALASQPEVMMSKVTARAYLGNWEGYAEQLRPVVRAEAGSAKMRRTLSHYLADMTALKCGWAPSCAENADAQPDNLSIEDWANGVFSSIRADSLSIGRKDTLDPEVALYLIDFASTIGSLQRRQGDYPQARRTADRFHALADRMVESYPKEANPYFILSEALVQQAKNQTREKDYVEADRLLLQAVEASKIGVSLDPDHPDGAFFRNDRHRRLKEHRANPEHGLSPLATSSQ